MSDTIALIDRLLAKTSSHATRDELAALRSEAESGPLPAADLAYLDALTRRLDGVKAPAAGPKRAKPSATAGGDAAAGKRIAALEAELAGANARLDAVGAELDRLEAYAATVADEDERVARQAMLGTLRAALAGERAP